MKAEIKTNAERNAVQNEILQGLSKQIVHFGIVKAKTKGSFTIENTSKYPFEVWTKSCTCVTDGAIINEGKGFKASADISAGSYGLPALQSGETFYLITQRGNDTLYTDLSTAKLVSLTNGQVSKMNRLMLGEYTESVIFYAHSPTPMYEVLQSRFLQRNKFKPSIAVGLRAYVIAPA